MPFKVKRAVSSFEPRHFKWPWSTWNHGSHMQNNRIQYQIVNTLTISVHHYINNCYRNLILGSIWPNNMSISRTIILLLIFANYRIIYYFQQSKQVLAFPLQVGRLLTKHYLSIGKFYLIIAILYTSIPIFTGKNLSP